MVFFLFSTEIKKSTTQKGTLQSLKTKYQEYEDTYNLNEPAVINELDDVHEIANEQVTGGKGISAKWLGVSNQFYNFEVSNAKV